VELRDLLGRRLRVLHEGPASTGMELAWDGNDASGRALPSGTYVLALTSAAGTHARQLQILR
jgi:flagellar hook assembly protein FlgD